jgi:hypothetical protein
MSKKNNDRANRSNMDLEERKGRFIGQPIGHPNWAKKKTNVCARR